VEKIVYCPLSGLQREIYSLFRAGVEENANNGNNADDSPFVDTIGANRKSLSGLNNLLMQLRKLCNHPYLVLEDMQTIPDSLYYEHLLVSSGKLFVLDRLLTQLLAQGSKVLIFSQMTAVLDILHGYLQGRGLSCARLDGSTPHETRETQLRDFNKTAVGPRNLYEHDLAADVSSPNAVPTPNSPTSTPPFPASEDPSVFLLSTRAGGVGINLQAADTVILFDSDWNPQQDLQATSRAHRIGQTRPVLVLRLVSVGPDAQTYSVEQRILRRATKKLHAERQVLANGLFDLSEPVESTVFVTPDHEQRGKQKNKTDGVDLENGVNLAQESLLTLFETITDSESVSTDCSSPRPCEIATARLHSLSACEATEQDSVPKIGKNLPKSTKSSKNLLDMYRMDFSAEGIARICERREENAECFEKEKTDQSCVKDDKELTTLMNYPEFDTWSAWLYPGDPRSGRERRAAVLKYAVASTDANLLPVSIEIGKAKSGSASRKRGFAEESLWKKVNKNTFVVASFLRLTISTTIFACMNR